jgi:hypothetical protein
VVDCGADIGSTIDDFHFAYKRLDRDDSITARIESLEDVLRPAKADIMIRASPDLRAKFAAVYVTPRSGVTYQTRPVADRIVVGGA